MMIDKEKVRSRLKDAIMLLCHTDLHFASNVAVEGLLGITLDNKDIMLISIKETLKGDLDTSSRSEPGVDTELQGISITEGSLLDTPHVVQNSSPSVKRRPDRTRTRTEVPVEPEPEPITITMSPSPEREDERVTEPAYESPEPRRKRARLRQSRPGSDNLPIVSSANLPSTVSKNVSGIQKTEVFDVKPVWGSEEDTGDLEDTVGSLQTAGIGITPDESSGSMPYTEPPGGGHSETAVPLHVQQNIFANFPMKQEPYFHHSEPEPGPSGTSADHSFKKGMDSEEVIPAPWTWSSADGRSISLASTSNVASSSVFHQQQQQHTDQSFVIEKSNEDGDADIDAAYDSESEPTQELLDRKLLATMNELVDGEQCSSSLKELDHTRKHVTNAGEEEHLDFVSRKKRYIPKTRSQLDFAKYYEVKNTNEPLKEGFQLLGPGARIAVDSLWFQSALSSLNWGKHRRKKPEPSPGEIIKRLMDGFYEPWDLCRPGGTKAFSSGLIFQALKSYASFVLGLNQTHFIRAWNEKMVAARSTVKRISETASKAD